MDRLASAVLWAAIGFLAAYVAWGPRAIGLEDALHRLARDNDYLRAQLSAGVDRTRGSGATTDPVHVALKKVMSRLSEQSEILSLQTDSVERLLEERDSGIAQSLHACDAAQTKMQEQLEKCLFAKAEAERVAAVAKREKEQPRRGSATVTETLTLPQIPDGASPRNFSIPRDSPVPQSPGDGSASGASAKDTAEGRAAPPLQ